MTNLSAKHKKIHNRAKRVGRMHGVCERAAVESLIEVERERIFQRIGHRSMLLYAKKEMKLSRPTALMLINVARSAAKFPELRSAIRGQRLSPSRASRIVAHLKNENVNEIIEYAETHTYSEIDFEMARRDPRAAAKDKIKPISAEWVEVRTTVRISTLRKIERTQSLLAQKRKPAALSDALEAGVEEYIHRHDPIRKAARSKVVCVHRPNERPTQAQKNARLALDGGQCTHINIDGERCDCTRWVEVHHVIRLSDGGTNDIENLRTLCWFHHAQAHKYDRDVNKYRGTTTKQPDA